MVEKLLPAAITVMAQVNMQKGIVPGFYWLPTKRHTGLAWCSTGFLHIALCAGTDNISPNGFSAHTPRNDMVERQFACRLAFSAILTPVLVPGEDVSAIKFYLAARQTIVKQQADNARHGNIEIYR